MERLAREPGRAASGPPTSTCAPATRLDVAKTAISLLALPVFVYYVWYCLEFNGGRLALPSAEMVSRFPFPTAAAIAIVAGWLAFQALLQVVGPGRWLKGTPLSDGSRLSYKMNGWFAWWVTLAMLGAGAAFGAYSLAALADQFGALLSTTNLAAYLLSVYLYWHGNRTRTAQERVTGNLVCDFWLGTALNPRVANFDLKLFCEARPGLIAWVVLDMAFAAKQYQLHGFVSTPMILVCAFHFWYVADYFWHEEAILTTWDIKHEKFGWMLCWGDLVWVPFMYTIQAYYLVEHTHDLTWWQTAGIVALNVIGMIIFRAANLQKHRFRQNPERLVWGKPPEYITTPTGSLLLTSGWWGLSRHMNYFGDLLMGLAWCLPCGFESPLPYFYIIYFTILLVHRERRDHHLCAARYGPAWDAYCSKVRYRIVPGLY